MQAGAVTGGGGRVRRGGGPPRSGGAAADAGVCFGEALESGGPKGSLPFDAGYIEPEETGLCVSGRKLTLIKQGHKKREN